MKKFITAVIVLVTAALSHAQTDTMYIYQAGSPVYKRAVSKIDSVIFYQAQGTVTDVDGNVYRTLKIGTQTWMVENLKVRHYRNGDPVPNVSDTAAWGSLTTGAFSWYDNDSSNHGTYGILYNWFAATDSRNIAPEGWHVPTDVEWTILVNYLGGAAAAGGKMKETGTGHWNAPNTGATNESGFNALPAGYRYADNGSFRQLGRDADWWTATQVDAAYAWFRNIYYDAASTGRYYYNKQNGFSIRCVMDKEN
jgi:uncharacterized protein (TIGR02145 family)